MLTNKKLTILLAFYLISSLGVLQAYPIVYAEQYYRLFHQHHYSYPYDTLTNITYLIRARSADFANPLYAISIIETKQEWEYYRYLFQMHISLLLVKQHMLLANSYDKYNAYFYNAPWQPWNLKSLALAEKAYKMALKFWDETLGWAEKANAQEFRWLDLENIADWEDESYLIMNEELDYAAIIGRDLQRLDRVRTTFESMDKDTY